MVMAGEAAQAGPRIGGIGLSAATTRAYVSPAHDQLFVLVVCMRDGCGRGFLRAAGAAGVSEAGGAEKARMARAFSALPLSRPCREGVRGRRC